MNTLLLSGAAGNLGTVVSSAFLQSGWHVHAAVHNTEQQTALQGLGAGEQLTTALADMSQLHDVESFVNSAPGAVSAVIHLVGGITAGSLIENTSPEVFERMMTINTRSCFNLLHAAMPVLKQSGGSIIAVGAKAALHPEQKKSAYAAAKAAVISLIQSAAEEGRAFGVRANVIVPSIIRTPANLEWASNGEERDWISPEQIASTLFFLCSDEGSGISGAVIPMYGGIPA